MSHYSLVKVMVSEPARVTVESDEELVWRATQEAEAFQALYRRYRLPIFRYHTAWTGNKQAAQELTAETFLAAFERIASYRFGGRFIKWLFGIAKLLRGDYSPSRADNFLPDAPFPPPGGDMLDSEAVFQMEISEIARALATLPEETAEALSLRLFAGLDTAEIGLVMVKSDAAVKMLVYRGLCDLKAGLSSRLENRDG